jgi:hypothetical protein
MPFCNELNGCSSERAAFCIAQHASPAGGDGERLLGAQPKPKTHPHKRQE